jgi:photosystem II stability/assembly factor-like uncharacterized protein
MKRGKLELSLIICFLLAFCIQSQAADRYWIATGAANWNSTANWSTTSGGSSGASVPGSSDIAIFNGSGTGSCTINAAVNVAGIDVQSGYTGTISQGANTITVGTSNATFAGGTFTGGSSAITINGTVTFSGTAFTSTSNTLTFNSTVTATGGSFTHNSGTVTFSSSSAQTIPAVNFYNLTSSSTGSRTLASSGTIGVAAVFTPSTNTYTLTGSTVDFNGGTQNIPAFTFNNLTCSGSGDKTATGAITVNSAITINSGRILDMATYALSGSSLTTSGTGKLKTQNTTSTPIPTGRTWSFEIEYNSSSGQTIVNGSYANLTSSSTGSRTLASSGTIGISGIFTPSTNTYTITSSTIDFNGSGSQTIPAFNYNHLTSSSTGTRTLASSGTVGVAGTFTKGSNTYTITGSTFNYNGTGAQTIVAMNYNNLTISGSRGANNITLANSGTIGIAATFSNTATFSGGAFVNTSSTINYNGTGAQTIIAFNYNHLTISGARTTNNITLASSGTINIAGTFTASATFTDGVYTISGSTVEYSGSSSQTIAAIDYNNLTSSSSGGRTLASSGVIRIQGTFTKGSNTYTSTGSTVNYFGGNAQTIVALDYNNLIISGSRGTNNITFENGGTIKVAKLFLPLASFSSGGYITTNTTIEYNGTLAQTIAPLNYNHLTSSSSGARNFGTNGTVKISGTFTNGSNTYTNYGTFNESFAPIMNTVFTHLLGVKVVNSSTIYVVGNAGVILKTSNGGDSWTKQTSNTTNDIFSVSFSSSSNGVCVGNSATVRYTTDGGSTWTTASAGTSSHLRYVYHKTADTVFLMGASGVIKKSVNGGSVWADITSSGTSETLYGMYFTSSTTGYAVGWNGTIIKTTDGGTNWTTQTSGTSEQLASVYFINSNTGFAVGTNGKIVTTTNGGTSWSAVTSGTTDGLNYVEFYDSNNGFVYGGNATNNTGIILKTTDGGVTWTTINTGTSRIYCADLLNSTFAYMVGIDGMNMKYTCCAGGGKVEFASSSSQTIPALNYHNLTFSSTGARTLASSGNVGLSGDFTPSTNSLTVTGSTLLLNGAKKQTIYNSPTLNNLSFAGTYNDTLYIGSNDTTTVNGTITIAGTKALAINTGNIKSLGDITITNSSTDITASSGLIKICGTGTQTLTGSGTANTGKLCNIRLDKPSGTLNLSSTISLVGGWNFVRGAVSAGSSTVVSCGSASYSCATSPTNYFAFNNFRVYSNTATLSGALVAVGNVLINSGATLNGNAKEIYLGGNWDNSGSFTYANTTVIFAGASGLGSANQRIIKASGTENFYDIKADKANGKLYLNCPVNVNNKLFLSKGVIVSTATNLLTFPHGSSIDTSFSGNDTCYISGPVKKIGNQTFTFPLGDTTLTSGRYHPLSITAPTNTTDAFTAQYYSSFSGTDTLAVDSIQMCKTEYWTIARNVGSSNVLTTLGWNSNNCLTTNTYDMVVSGWDGSIWKSLEGNNITINGSKGAVKSTITPYWSGTNPVKVTLARKKEINIKYQIREPYCVSGVTTGHVVHTITKGAPPFSYSWAHGPTTKDLSGLAKGNYTLTIIDRHARTFIQNYSLDNCVQWNTLPGTLINDTLGTITKNSGGNDWENGLVQGTLIYDSIVTGEWIKFVMADTLSDYYIGFGSVWADSAAYETNYMISVEGKYVTIIETDNDGFYSKVLLGSYLKDDILKIELSENGIKYYRNDALVHTGKMLSTSRLRLTTNVYGQNDVIKKIRCSTN